MQEKAGEVSSTNAYIKKMIIFPIEFSTGVTLVVIKD
jgi:hypothetical protein